MSVQKLSRKSQSISPIVPFTQVSNHVINNIKNAEAFLVWTYLLSKTAEWIVIKSHIKNHFGFGDRKIIRIFKYLNERKLIKYVAHRCADGTRFAHTDIHVLDGTEFVIYQKLNVAQPTVSETYSVESCMYSNDTPTKERDLLNKEEETKEISHASQNDAQESDSSFDQFWSIYPKKKDKKRCKEKFKKLPMGIIALILVKLEQQVKEDQQWKELRFVPYPSTYLENERWLDDIVRAIPAKVANLANPLNKNHSPEIKCTVPDWGPGHPGYDSLHGLH